ncbi:transposase [Leisingera sp. M527]|uniref:transposase n=1 Tax=Leisingera sp. M527 TaxID=2867014 RepID=UPI0021A332E9|nr:transposase [Leisingera sp. M527]
MADQKFRPEIEVLTAADTPRRRHWSDANKIRIVEERFVGHRQVGATARRHGVSRSLLTIWRQQYRQVPVDAFAWDARANTSRTAWSRRFPTRDRAEERAPSPCPLHRGSREAGPASSGAGGAMIALPAGVRVWIAGGVTDMRRGMPPDTAPSLRVSCRAPVP